MCQNRNILFNFGSLVSVCSKHIYKGPYILQPEMDFIFPQDLIALLAVVTIIDLRTTLEYNSGHIKGAINLILPLILVKRFLKNPTLELLGETVKQQCKADATVVLYNTLGLTIDELVAGNTFAGTLYKLLSESGINIKILAGGFNGWCEQQFPIVVTQVKAVTYSALPPPSPKDERDPDSFKCAIDGFIHIGSEATAANTPALKKAGITHILNLCQSVPNPEFEGLHLPFLDVPTQSLGAFLPCGIRYIESVRLSGGRLFVHCHAGISRSVSIVLAYLIWTKRISVLDALKEVTVQRPCASPNIGFLGQLMIFEKSLPVDTADFSQIEHTVRSANI